MKSFGWMNIITGVLTLVGVLDKTSDVGVSLLVIALGVITLILVYREENNGSPRTKDVANSLHQLETTDKQ